MLLYTIYVYTMLSYSTHIHIYYDTMILARYNILSAYILYTIYYILYTIYNILYMMLHIIHIYHIYDY